MQKQRISVEEGFFFYPLYKKEGGFERIRAKNLLILYIAHPRNRFNVIKEIIDINQLITFQTMNIYDFLSANPINKNYSK